jgi:RimJ/RimL family protein N-acetyltransferase
MVAPVAGNRNLVASQVPGVAVGLADSRRVASLRVPFDRQPTLLGELVEARPLRPDDFDALFAAAADPANWEQHPEPDRWRRDVFRGYFDDHLVSGGALVILDRATGATIGATRYDNLDEESREVEIGWTFLTRAYWGGRYNADLKRVMLEHVFRSLDTVLFLVGEHNLRSRRAVEKLGATEAGRRRGLVLYRLTAAAWVDRPQDGAH